MRSKSLFFFLMFSIILFGCGGSKDSQKIRRGFSLESIMPYEKCNDLVPLNDIKDDDYLLKNLNDLSFSTTYTSIYTPYYITSDTIQKDSIRYLYAKNIKEIVKTTFPKIELINDSILLSKSYQYIVENSNHIYSKTEVKNSIKNLTTKASNSKKQLFIYNSSSIWKNKISVTVRFFVFDLEKQKVLYKDLMKYNCDIRDYEALEKVISYGLVKLKENFE